MHGQLHQPGREEPFEICPLTPASTHLQTDGPTRAETARRNQQRVVELRVAMSLALASGGRTCARDSLSIVATTNLATDNGKNNSQAWPLISIVQHAPPKVVPEPGIEPGTKGL
jgi:hypothetical protein